MNPFFLPKMIWSVISLSIFVSIFPNATVAQQVNIEVEPRIITVGDPVEIRLFAETSQGEEIIWPAHDQFAPAEVLSADTVASGERSWEIKFLVSLYEPGQQQLPDLPIIINRPDGADTVWVTAGEIKVESILAPADTLADIRDIRPPVKLAWTFRDLLPFIIGAVTIILLGIVAYLLWRRHMKRKGLLPEFQPPPIPPHVVALRRLDELRIRKLWQSGKPKEYYIDLTEIIKEYIGGRYSIIALEMTTTELLDNRRDWNTTDELYRSTRRILTTGDMVKFARFKPDPHQNEKNLEAAFDLVNQTKVDFSIISQSSTPAAIADEVVVEAVEK